MCPTATHIDPWRASQQPQGAVLADPISEPEFARLSTGGRRIRTFSSARYWLGNSSSVTPWSEPPERGQTPDFSPSCWRRVRKLHGAPEANFSLPGPLVRIHLPPAESPCLAQAGSFCLLVCLVAMAASSISAPRLEGERTRRRGLVVSRGSSLPGHSRKHREQAGYTRRHSPVRPRSYEQLTMILLMVSMANGAPGSLATGIIQG